MIGKSIQSEAQRVGAPAIGIARIPDQINRDLFMVLQDLKTAAQ